MKKRLLIIAVFALSIVGCSTISNDKKTETNSTTKANSVIQLTANKSETGKSTIKLTKAGFLNQVMDYEKNPDKWVFLGDKPCIIDFYADWCGPCRMVAPVLEDVAAQYKGKVNIYKVDTQTERELAGILGISSLPTFMICPKEGNPQVFSGVGRSYEENKTMFVNIIENDLLK